MIGSEFLYPAAIFNNWINTDQSWWWYALLLEAIPTSAVG